MTFWKQFAKDIARTDERHLTKIDRKEDRVKKFRKEVSRKAAIANKRLKRLEEAGMTSSPAYQKWLDGGGEYFSVRGKSYNEAQSEMARVNSYLDNSTSSITGAKKVVKAMMENTGMNHQYSDFKQIQQQAKTFFEIAGKIEQYMRTVEDRASSIGYQKIWDAINQYTRETKQDLDVSVDEVERISAEVIKAMKVWEEKDIHDTTAGYDIWTKLPKF